MEKSINNAKRRRLLRNCPAFYLVLLACIGISAFRSTFGKNVPLDTNIEKEIEKIEVLEKELEIFSTIFTPEEGSETGRDEKFHSTISTTTVETTTETQSIKEDSCPSGRRPAIEQFPKPWMSQNVRSKGGVLFYVFVTAYTFLAVAIVCDEFFVPSLEILCEAFKISPDVAGATFMAAGSSAPELATALIGVFIAHDDIGVSGVIGSAVFNILFVISICGLLTTQPLNLNWWPLVRDCFFYMVSILALLGTIADESIEWYESIILLLLYGVYCYVMYMNDVLEAWAHTLPVPLPVHVPQVNPDKEKHALDEKSHLVTYKATGSGTANASDDPYQQKSISTAFEDEKGEGFQDGTNRMNPRVVEGANKIPAPPERSILSLFDPPAEGGFKKILWRISLPLVYVLYYSVPDCRIEKWRTWYSVTFCFSMIWIAIFSYIMVWMITVIGFTLSCPDTVMGLTFVAAGVSVPDALSSLAVMKDGFGDMAVSNAVGSNVFDILVCLGLPWFLSTVIVHPGVSVKVLSKGLVYSTLSLLSTVAFLLLATHYNGWKLDKKYGVILMVWYIFFMVFASMYELNVFGDFNPKECPSNF